MSSRESVAVRYEPDWFAAYRRLEEACTELFAYDPLYVHGLLQGEEYTRWAVQADGECDVDVLKGRLDVRLNRKLEALGRPGKRITAVIGVARLVPGIGTPAVPPAVMRRQLSYLRAMAVPGDIEIRVLPQTALKASPYPAFTLMEFGNPPGPPVAYLESQDDATYLKGAFAVAEYRDGVALLMAESVPVREFRP